MHRPAGGLKSRNVVAKPVRTGVGARAIRPGGAGQIGISQGSHITERGETNYRGAKFYGDAAMNPVKYGNEIATNVGKGGPGAGRVLYGQSGLQGQHGKATPGANRPSTKGQWPD